jgi:transcriptional regulator with XRE-family HTH domain
MKRDELARVRMAKGNRPVVAAQLGISVIHLRKLEGGDVNPSAPLLAKISDHFKESPDKLFPDLFPKNQKQDTLEMVNP